MGQWPRVGFADESYRRLDGRLVHVLGAVEPMADLDHLRAALDGLLRKGQSHLHFRQEDEKGQLELAVSVGTLPVRLTAVVCRSEERVERARGVSVEALAWHIHPRVDRLVFERRQPKGDRHDRSVLEGLKRRHGLAVDCGFAGKDEPLIGAADVVAGAVRLAAEGTNPEPRRALGVVEVIEI